MHFLWMGSGTSALRWKVRGRVGLGWDYEREVLGRTAATVDDDDDDDDDEDDGCFESVSATLKRFQAARSGWVVDAWMHVVPYLLMTLRPLTSID